MASIFQNLKFILFIFFIFYSCTSDIIQDDKLYKKNITTSHFIIHWYTKSGLTKAYPEYVEIYNIKTEQLLILEENEIDDINFYLGDTLEIMCGRHLDFDFLNKKDTLINGLIVTYEKSKLDYNNPIKYDIFKNIEKKK